MVVFIHLRQAAEVVADITVEAEAEAIIAAKEQTEEVLVVVDHLFTLQEQLAHKVFKQVTDN
jgi:hypothetical protein